MRTMTPLIAAALAVPLAASAQTTTTTITIPQFSITVQSTTTGATATTPVVTTPTPTPTGGGTPTPVPTPTGGGTPVPTPTPTPVVTGQSAALTVGPGQAIVEPADALGNISPGGVLTVLPGTYKKAFSNSVDHLTIKCSVDTKCIMDGQGGFGLGHRLAWGKACFHTVNASMTVVGFKFVNCGSPQSGSSYSNEAAVYLDDGADGKPHTLTVQHSSFDNNANGIFSANPLGTVIVDSDVFGFAAPNGMNGYVVGTSSGPAHDMYLAAASVEVKGSYFYGSSAHNVKTRAKHTDVHDNPVMTEDGGRVTDLSDGGALTFANNGVWSRDDTTFPKRTIQAGLRTGVWGNSNLIGVGTENVNAGVPSGSITGSTFNIGRGNSTFWVNGGGALTSSGNKLNLCGSGGIQIQGNLTGDLAGASAAPGAPAHCATPPNPPAWFSP